ncbi:hypothetical protein DEU56DRAFT_922657 [Suillus clintonianus]|uniref:uncharacterized protein n=1 Tax=Suillus clintonianus TaxID=1904413 RepID=UPI001B885148|nr:uncharacterized protein DEU56DRAFT_922657 [Suillus clintonianus]KAG2150398.1 hypothetical protein DEU56DRAFT_922657 [Suillus clintonianus]
MTAQIMDWASIEESNRATLKSQIPRVRGGKKEYGLLTATLETMLEIKEIATQEELEVPGVTLMTRQYLRAIKQGNDLKSGSWWKKIRNMRDWDDDRELFRGTCQRVWNLANQTSLDLAKKTEKAASRAPIKRRISLETIYEHGRRHNQLEDTAAASTAANNEPAAQKAEPSATTSEKIHMFQEETIRHVADATAAKIFELLLHRHSKGNVHINNYDFQGCVIGASGRTAPTVNYGGKNNKGAG